MDALIEIARTLAPRAKSAVTAVMLASTKSAAYVAKHRARLAERSIEKPYAGLPWIALVDALIAAHACVEIDWKTDAENVAWALGKITTPIKAPAKVRAAIERESDERSTWELLELAGAALRPHGVQLAYLDIGSDSFCLVLIPIAEAARLVALAKKAKLGAIELFGDQLGAATKDRIARAKRHAAEAKREAARAAKAAKNAPPLHCFAKGTTWVWLAHADRRIEIGRRDAKGRYYREHTYATRALAKKALAQHIADETVGFRSITREAAEALPGWADGYGYLGVLPKNARYFVSGTTVLAFAIDGATTWRSSGALKRSFGMFQHFEHHATPAAAAKAFAAACEQYAHYKEWTRAKVAARY